MPQRGPFISKQAHHRLSQRGGQVHRPAVAADDNIADGQAGDQVPEVERRDRQESPIATSEPGTTPN